MMIISYSLMCGHKSSIQQYSSLDFRSHRLQGQLINESFLITYSCFHHRPCSSTQVKFHTSSDRTNNLKTALNSA